MDDLELKAIINPHAYRHISNYLIKPYQLNEAGSEYVIKSNCDLPESYFEHLFFPVSRFWQSYFRDKLDVLQPLERKSCLDVCCGTGTLCLNIMPGAGFERCIAIDNSAPAIDALKKRIVPGQNIEVHKEDITKTTFEADRFDAVYGNSFLHHLPDNHKFLIEVKRILKPGGVVCFTGEPTVGAAFLESVIMMNIIKLLVFLRLKKRKNPDKLTAVTDIWLYEEKSLRKMLSDIGFVDIKIQGFGVLVPLLNWPTALVLEKVTGKSMQPEIYWKWLGWLDKKLLFWLPPNKHSHFVIAARKPTL